MFYFMENLKKDGPVEIELMPGKIYEWCKCGKSETQPFCDGRSHIGTGHEPKTFQVTQARKVWLCMCKKTSKMPYCDGSHLK